MGVGKYGIVNIIIYDKGKKMSGNILSIIGIICILILAAISILGRIERKRKSSEMIARIEAMNKKINEFFWRQDESNM